MTQPPIMQQVLDRATIISSNEAHLIVLDDDHVSLVDSLELYSAASARLNTPENTKNILCLVSPAWQQLLAQGGIVHIE